MVQERWTAVDDYLTELFISPDDALESALKISSEAGLPPINVTPVQGKMLQVLAFSCQARFILEIGTLGGYSTIWLARALPADGKLITLESNAGHARIARSNLERAKLGNLVEVRLGDALETLPQIFAEKRAPFDFVFIDADKENAAAYFEWALKMTRPGGLIIVDNVVRGGAVVEADSDDANVRGVRRLNELLAAEPRVTETVVQTVGSKGYDGFAIAVVNEH